MIPINRAGESIDVFLYSYLHLISFHFRSGGCSRSR